MFDVNVILHHIQQEYFNPVCSGSKNICLHTTLCSNSKWPQEVLQVTCLHIKSPAWHKRALIHILELVVPQQKPEGLSVPIRPLSSCRHSDVNCRMNSLLQRER